MLLDRIVILRVTRLETSHYINRRSSETNSPEFRGADWCDVSLSGTSDQLYARHFGYTWARQRHSKGDS